MSIRCRGGTHGTVPVEVVVGNSGSKTKEVVLFSPYNGECPGTFVLGTDNFDFQLLDGCWSGNQEYDGPRAFEGWIHDPADNQVANV